MSEALRKISNLGRYRVRKSGQPEGIRSTLYDFQAYAAAGQQQLIFFQTPKGGTKTIADTNMEAAGQLPAGKFFLVESIEIMFFPGVLPVTSAAAAAIGTAPAVPNFMNDMYTVQKSGSLKFFIGSKTNLEEAPLGKFPPKTRLDTAGAAAGLGGGVAGAGDFVVSNTIDYAQMAGRPFRLDPEVLLEPTQNFLIELNWPAAVALPSGQAGRIGIVLDGILRRDTQ